MEEKRTIKQNDEALGKVIRSGAVANRLLDKGYRIIHVKKDRSDPDGKKSVYVFEQSDGLADEISKIMNDRQNRDRNIEDRVKLEVEARVREEMEKYMEKFRGVGEVADV